jgi:hypothetical protein
MVVAQRMPVTTGGVYQGGTIRVDGQRFIDCTFQSCTLEFAGEAVPFFERCTFIDVSWSFVEGAGNTIAFLQAMYNTFGSGGEGLVNTVFDMVRNKSLMPGFPAEAGELPMTPKAQITAVRHASPEHDR